MSCSLLVTGLYYLGLNMTTVQGKTLVEVSGKSAQRNLKMWKRMFRWLLFHTFSDLMDTYYTLDLVVGLQCSVSLAYRRR